jgi:hypothetical protein
VEEEEGSVKIDTGDQVVIESIDEIWLVAYVKDDHVYGCGWPYSCIALRHCKLIVKATPEQRLSLLRNLASMKEQDDPRCVHARGVLEAPEEKE